LLDTLSLTGNVMDFELHPEGWTGML
jgi:hypothetical protein